MLVLTRDHGLYVCDGSFEAHHELNRHLLSAIDVALHILRVEFLLENATMDDAEIFTSGPNGRLFLHRLLLMCIYATGTYRLFLHRLC